MLPIYVLAGRNIIPYPSPYRVKPVGYSGFGYPLPPFFSPWTKIPSPSPLQREPLLHPLFSGAHSKSDRVQPDHLPAAPRRGRRPSPGLARDPGFGPVRRPRLRRRSPPSLPPPLGCPPPTARSRSAGRASRPPTASTTSTTTRTRSPTASTASPSPATSPSATPRDPSRYTSRSPTPSTRCAWGRPPRRQPCRRAPGPRRRPR
jgi:hypothetical protein